MWALFSGSVIREFLGAEDFQAASRLRSRSRSLVVRTPACASAVVLLAFGRARTLAEVYARRSRGRRGASRGSDLPCNGGPAAVTFATLFAYVGLSISDAFKGIEFKDDLALASSVFYLSFVDRLWRYCSRAPAGSKSLQSRMHHWPTLSGDDFGGLVTLEVRAGSN